MTASHVCVVVFLDNISFLRSSNLPFRVVSCKKRAICVDHVWNGFVDRVLVMCGVICVGYVLGHIWDDFCYRLLRGRDLTRNKRKSVEKYLKSCF